MSLLDAAGELWIVLVGGEIHLIDKVARTLGALAEGLYLAQGGQLDGAGKKARQSQRDEGMRLLYAAVDLPFRALSTEMTRTPARRSNSVGVVLYSELRTIWAER